MPNLEFLITPLVVLVVAAVVVIVNIHPNPFLLVHK
jgi:hypothetical protein